MNNVMIWIAVIAGVVFVLPMLVYIISRAQMHAWLNVLREFIKQEEKKG